MSALTAIVLVTLLLLAVAVVWIAGHERAVRARASALCQLAAVDRLMRGFRPWVRSVATRLGFEVPALLALAAGFALVLLFGVLFTYVLDSVLEGDGITHVDEPALRWIASQRDGWLTDAMRAVTHLGDARTLAAVAAAVCLVAARRARRLLPVVLTVVGAAGIALVVAAAKALVGRPRPAAPSAAITADGWSFPSGHAAGVAAVLLLSAWVLTRWVVHAWILRVLVWGMAIVLTAVVGLSRAYLGVHYLSDVVAGWALGAAWAGILVLVARLTTATGRARSPTGDVDNDPGGGG